MKNLKTLLFAAIFFALAGIVNAQSVGINSDGSSPDGSAMLDVSSSSKGFLLPRMTSAQMNAIVNPSGGLMIFCTDCGSGGSLAIYINDSWNLFNLACQNPPSPISGTHIPGSTQIEWKWSSSTGNTFSYKWNTTNDYASATDMGTSTTKTETALSCNTTYSRYVWAYNSCGASAPLTLTQSTAATPPSAFTEGTHVQTGPQIVWNWTASTGANGYKWNTTNDFSTATDLGNVLTKTETGLAADPVSYTRYVWAYSNCGESLVTLSQQLMYVGAGYGGGKVAYILQSGDPGYDVNTTHGLIAATSDQGSLPSWGCSGVALQGADGTAIGTGSQNTLDIVAGCAESGIGARLCADLSLNGFTDWYLPSIDELTKVYINRASIGTFALSYPYMSSSETSSNTILIKYFFNGAQEHTLKTEGISLRPIRSF